VSFVTSSSSVRASPITVEYRKNNFFKKLLFSQVFADFDQVVSNSDIRYGKMKDYGSSYDHYYSSDISSNAFLQEFLTSEEKSLLSSLDEKRLLDLKTDTSLFILGFGLGLDLWIFEWSYSPFLMYYDTTVTLRSCKFRWHASSGHSQDYMPERCDFNPNDIIDLGKQNYSGFGFGQRNEFSLVLLQTDNWRISMDTSMYDFYSSFDNIEFRGLNFSTSYEKRNTLGCKGYRIGEDKDADLSNQRVETWIDGDCKNTKGEDMSTSADWTGGIKITYYFR